MSTNYRSQIYIHCTLIAFIQLLDIAVHVVNGMVEPIRIVASLLIFSWLGVVLSGRLNHITPQRLATGFIGAYILLNGIFLAMEGFTNPENGDQFRTTLFILVGLTVGLSIWLTNLIAKRAY